MAVAFQVAGPVAVWVAHLASNLQPFLLGYTANGVDIRHNPRWSDYFSDANGGADGPPTDVIFLGETATIRMELTRWDAVIAEQVCSRACGRPRPPRGTSGYGTNAPAGTLMFASWGPVPESAIGLGLLHRGGSRTYPHAILRGSNQLTMGSRFSRLILEFECYARSEDGVLCDDSWA